MPVKLRAQAKAAVERLKSKPITPDVNISSDNGQWSYNNPYSAADDLGWHALLFEAFGTRQGIVADVFLMHLAQLCSSAWDSEAQAWRPNVSELQAAIAIVRSMAPKNEAQAALAAQAVAIHFTTMKLARSMAGRFEADARSSASLAALGKAYARQLETLQRLQGNRTSRQRITVKNEKHVHNHQHIHVDGGGAETGGQAHETIQCRTGCNGLGSPVPGQDATGNALSLSCDERPLTLPSARRGQRVRRTAG